MRKAVVVLSGGQDSATCAAWASEKFEGVEFVTFDYGQRHYREIESAKRIANLFGGYHEVIPMPVFPASSNSGLVNQAVGVCDVDPTTNLPTSFVPGRNLVFLTAAASWAMGRGIYHLVTGVCQTDYSGYPDCREQTIRALENAIRKGTAGLPMINIHTPLMHLTKKETVQLARQLVKGWDALALSWTCYEGGERPCGKCPACVLRAKGFSEAMFDDPALAHYSEV